MNRICVSAVALLAMAGAANAQVVEFRLYERTGQASASSADALLEIGVQARVIGSNLGTFNFDIHTGDSQTGGTLARARISVNGSYVSNGSAWAANSSIGAGGINGGLAAGFSYLAGINANFNGLINLTGGSFVDNPAENEIGLVAGAATGGALLGVPGMDPDGEGNPATWAGYGVGGTPTSGETAPLDPALAPTYFAAGQFIDLYHFRYTVTDFTARTLNFTLGDLSAQVFQQLLFSNGAWGTQNLAPSSISSSGLQINVVPTPASAALMGLGGLVIARRRRA